MIRGSTPLHTFTLPFDPPEGAQFRIVYAQGEDFKESILFERDTSTCTVDGRNVSVKLTSEETLLFDANLHFVNGIYQIYPVKVQIGVKTVNETDEDIIWSNIITTTVDRCLREDGAV